MKNYVVSNNNKEIPTTNTKKEKDLKIYWGMIQLKHKRVSIAGCPFDVKKKGCLYVHKISLE